MAYMLTWPKRRRLGELEATLSPGRLLLTAPSGAVVLDCQDPDELRAFALQAHAAAVELELSVKADAAKALADRRLARKARGEELGLLHRPFVDLPEPALHMDLERPA